ncbi:MAG: ABC transporter ATP-binding protein [Mucinivorans sp.]
MIKLNDLSFAYKGKAVFGGLSLELQQGSIYGLLGKNGAGKTTLLKLLSGLLFPRQGTVLVDGKVPAERGVHFLEQIFLLPEEFELPRMTILQYSSLCGRFYPCFSAAQMSQYLSTLSVDAAQPLHKMSFGQRKKAYIAFALACNTRYLLMDEPTNGLDIPSKGEFRRLMSAQSTAERTIVISTHQVRDLEQLIDAVVILEGSQILLNATEAQITERLQFKHIQEDDEPLYSEKTIHGTWGVCSNSSSAESELDMELLFNAVVSAPASIKQIFESHE